MISVAAEQTSYIPNSDDENAQSLADYILSDPLHAGKNIPGASFRQTLEAFALEFTRMEEKHQELADEMDPQRTIELISEWEKIVSIPDQCFPVTSGLTVEARRKQVVAKLALMNATTKQDFIDVAAFFGVSVQITNALDKPSLGLTGTEGLMTMVVTFNIVATPSTFPLTFPIAFGFDEQTNQIQCLFQKMAPMYIDILYEFL